MTNITDIAIIGDEIFIYRRFILHRYKNSWRRAALIRSTVIMKYLYRGIVKWDLEQYHIKGELPVKYSN